MESADPGGRGIVRAARSTTPGRHGDGATSLVRGNRPLKRGQLIGNLIYTSMVIF